MRHFVNVKAILNCHRGQDDAQSRKQLDDFFDEVSVVGQAGTPVATSRLLTPIASLAWQAERLAAAQTARSSPDGLFRANEPSRTKQQERLTAAEALQPGLVGRLGASEYLRAGPEDVNGGAPSARVRLSPVTPPPEADAEAGGGRETEPTAASPEHGLGLRLAAWRVEPSPEAVERDGPGGPDGREEAVNDSLRAAEEARRRAESELRAAREEIAALRRQVGHIARASIRLSRACLDRVWPCLFTLAHVAGSGRAFCDCARCMSGPRCSAGL